MPNRKIPENEIHELCIDITKRIGTTYKSWQYPEIVKEFAKHYNGLYEAFLDYNKSCDNQKEIMI